MASKSTLMAYFLWMTFGWLGVHHLYLRRHRHGFVWLWTFGGCCGLGWLLELWRLPYYVGIANDTVTTSHRHTASYSWKQITGELVFSMVLGVLSVSAIPKSIVAFSPLLPFLAIIFIAAGVHTVANIDHCTQCSYLMCLLGACIPLPVLLLSFKLDAFLTYACLSSVIIANVYGVQRRQQSQHQTHSVSNNACCTWLGLSAANLLISVMLISALYHNCSVTTHDGVRIPLKDALYNIIMSPAWAEFRRTIQHLFHCLVYDGLQKFVFELSIVLDPEGESSAYRLLGFTESSSVNENQLTERYRQLVRQFHPDKVHTSTELEHQRAEQRFIAIQQAYEKLSVIKQRRRRSADRSDL